MGAYAFVLFALLGLGLGLGLRSQYVDKHDAGVAQQLAKQKTEEEEYTRKPFEPELSSASLAAANVAPADPLAAKGKTIFEAQSCNACHGDSGMGTAAALLLLASRLRFHPLSWLNFLSIPPQR
jgi:cytochrome c